MTRAATVQDVDPYEILTREAEPPDAVVRYADHADGLIDVFLPPTLGPPANPFPVVVFVHGGFWREEWDRMHARPLANALARSGFVVAVPEYRRVGGAGGWPTTAYDVERALTLVPSMVSDVAPRHTDQAQAVVLAGHSAGGQLALWAGLRAGPTRVSAIVALAPVTDLEYAARARMGGGAVQDLLGGEPGKRAAAYAEADVLALLDSDVAVTIVQGDADEQVDPAMNREVASRFASIEYVELAGVEHFGLIDPLAPAYSDVLLPCLSRG